MDTINTIKTRRSIRKFKPDPISKEDIEEILIAAMHAPSACNRQPWHFIVIEDRSMLNTIPSIHPYSQMCKQADKAILICADKNLEDCIDYLQQDCSAATQNLLLAAHDKGLGSVWLGVYPKEELIINMQKLLDFPDNIVPISLIALGYPAEENRSVERFKKDRIHYNTW